MKLTYICDHTPEENQFGAVGSRGYENTYPKVTMEFEATTIETMLRQFKDFLLGCGFVVDGEIVIEPPVENTPDQDSGKREAWMFDPSSDIRKLKEEE